MALSFIPYFPLLLSTSGSHLNLLNNVYSLYLLLQNLLFYIFYKSMSSQQFESIKKLVIDLRQFEEHCVSAIHFVLLR
jgi:hypothetical protein